MTYTCLGCEWEVPSDLPVEAKRSTLVKHKQDCNFCNTINNVLKPYHDWCKNKALNGYAIYLLNKQTEMTYYYFYDGTTITPFLVDIQKLKRNICEKKLCVNVLNHENVEIYVGYYSPLLPHKIRKIKQSVGKIGNKYC